MTINDYLAYCNLPQDEIDNAVFGSNDPYRNIKRRYVFQIIYGIYDVATAERQEELRNVLAELRALNNQTAAFERFLAGSVLENRAAIDREIATTEVDLAKAQEARALMPSQATPVGATELRGSIAALELRISERRAALARERAHIEQLSSLEAQLMAQSARMTRSIVADEYLVDFDFVVCPRCGSSIQKGSPADDVCYLCHQTPTTTLTRVDLIKEQERIEAQISETRELLAARESLLGELERIIGTLEQERRTAGNELDLMLRTFVSDSATSIAAQAAKAAELEGALIRLREYRTLFSKLDATGSEIGRLDSRRMDLQAAIESSTANSPAIEERITVLESEFDQMLERFHAPRFADPPYVNINRTNYLPIVDGRSFEELSSQGLQVLVNVAHALAHHITALQLDLNLPGILLIDGLTSNVGHEGEDYERVRGVYSSLIAICETFGEDLQIIVADNDVPKIAHDFVVADLSEDDRLIRSVGAAYPASKG